jgi:hypothetical protein
MTKVDDLNDPVRPADVLSVRESLF